MWGAVNVKGAPPPSRLDHAMTTICLPLSLNGGSTDVAESSPPSQPSPVTTSTTSHPHLVTVISPETIDNKTMTSSKSAGKAEPGDASSTIRAGVDETCDSGDQKLSAQAQSEGVDPLLKELLKKTVCAVQINSVSSAAEVAQGSTTKRFEKQRNSQYSGGVEALVVFGGMDTSGHIHSDCFVIVPP